MKKRIPAKALISIFCVLVLLLAAMLGSCAAPQPAEKPTVQTDPNEEEEHITEPTGGEIDTDQGEKDPDTGDNDPDADPDQGDSNTEQNKPDQNQPTGIVFPYTLSEYDLVIEKMAPYTGIFVEDGTNAKVENVAMLLVQNKGDLPVEYAELCIACGEEQLVFTVSALPAGEKLVVQEKSAKTIPAGNVSEVTATVAQREDMELSKSQVEVTDNGDNTLTIRNLTEETVAAVRVFYKYYMEEEGVFVGGIAFTVRITRLGAGASVTVQPSHYTSKTSRVVMVQTYDSEV